MPKSDDVPACPSIPVVQSTGREAREYLVELITPLFGGGVEPGRTDADHPIRETAIRGHLRHWWRFTVGRRLGDSMKQREEEIFGSTEFPSPLTVQVLNSPTIQLVEPTYGDRFGPIAYALFPAVENTPQQLKVAKEGGTFHLRLSWDNAEILRRRRRAQNEARHRNRQAPLPENIEDISSDIDTALRAWIAYGGIGARTRRGCGALHCVTLSSEKAALPGKILIGDPVANPIEAWKAAVSVYQEFRQTPRGGKHPKTIRTKDGPKSIQVPGRSHWPEADSIRQITGCSLKPRDGAASKDLSADVDTTDHSRPVAPTQTLPSFPKAVLGMPINFHFADGPGKNRPGQVDKDPQDVQLVPVLPDTSGDFQKCDRLSSPVITRPLWKKGKWHPAVIILDQRLPSALRVRLEGKRARAGGEDVSCDFPLSQVIDPKLGAIRPMRGKSSALDALVHFLTEEKRFTEVTR